MYDIYLRLYLHDAHDVLPRLFTMYYLDYVTVHNDIDLRLDPGAARYSREDKKDDKQT